MSRIKILHLEDDDLDAELMSSLILAGGIEGTVQRVSNAGDYQSALESGSFDLILSDYSIPGYNGLEALRYAQTVTPSTPFIFLSGTLGEEAAVESLQHGATDFILKQRPARLCPAITRALKEAEAEKEQEVATQLRRFQSNILRHVLSGVIVTRLDGEITYWNEGARKIFGMAPERVLGSILWEVPFLGGESDFQKVHGTCLLRHQMECEFEWGEDSHWIHVNSSVMRGEDAKPSGCLFILTDVTDRKDAEAAILRMNIELEERVAERTSALSMANDELKRFAHTVSHDLRSPLRAVMGYSQILREDYAEILDDEGVGALERIKHACNRMDQLIQGLLHLATLNRSSLRKEPVDLSEIVRDVAQSFAEEMPNRRVEWRIVDTAKAFADAKMMRAALTNLVDNALKFSSLRENSVIEFGVLGGEGETVYFVRDNGVGFDKQLAERVFDDFHRGHAEEEFEGMGIGLSTVKRIVTRHGGQVWAESELGKETTILFTLPAEAKR